ncbi:MAG TPA: alpha/beta fold hydrolase, partial [Candidatus Sulfotelmatobacter sp.]|nr:alpha/beta fold hydrolase [Candidatus Sulfotelmatobacter sp.]
MATLLRPAMAVLFLAWLAGCSGVSPTTSPRPAHQGTSGAASTVESPSARTPTSTQSPAFPPYYIESMRATGHPGGHIDLGAALRTVGDVTTFDLTWPSSLGTMTGTVSMPAGSGPFPVVIVNHGYAPPSSYPAGLDTWKYADYLSAHGYIAIAPSYPGYLGSSPPPPELPPIAAEAISVMDLVGSVPSLPRADPFRITMVGHSNGGGVALLVSVADPRVRAFALLAPVSSDMADNARRFWLRGRSSAGPLGDPANDPEAYAHFSPRNYFGTFRSPVLVVQGAADEQIPAEWTQATLT